MIISTEPDWRSGGPIHVVGLQVVVGLALSTFGLLWGWDVAQAVLLGSAVAYVPNACFAWVIAWDNRRRAEGKARERSALEIAEQATMRVYMQWLTKAVWTMLLLTLVIADGAMASLGLFVGLGATLLAPMAAPWVWRMAGRTVKP